MGTEDCGRNPQAPAVIVAFPAKIPLVQEKGGGSRGIPSVPSSGCLCGHAGIKLGEIAHW